MPSPTTLPNRRKTPAEIALPQGEVRIVESHHAAEFVMAMDAWPFHKIAWTAMGSGRLEFDSGWQELKRDDFVVLPSHRAHRFVDDPRDPLTLVLFCLSPAFIDNPGNPERALLWASIKEGGWVGRVLRARTAFHQTALVERFRLALREQSAHSVGWKTVLRGLADGVLVRLARGHLVSADDRPAANSRKSIEGAIETIDHHPNEPRRIADVAAQCRLSERRFTQLFKKITGETFISYLNRRRIEYACERLRETGHILYACHESGFNDPAYFYRIFKAQTGRTPGAFLRDMR
ncbi:MAG: AraC family transcriptional regulator [Methylacidiphilales bacterium]|nr:AraC family transcriptional regulator [Candidatus Methylacidiphilales bacterium]